MFPNLGGSAHACTTSVRTNLSRVCISVPQPARGQTRGDGAHHKTHGGCTATSLQEGLDLAAWGGRWTRAANDSDGWAWQVSRSASCIISAARRLPGWTLVIGDSRGRFLFASLLATINGTDPADRPPARWPSHRVPTKTGAVCGPAAKSWYYSNDATCRSLFRGDCNNDNFMSRTDQAGKTPGCVLDFQANRQRLTFVWHAMSTESAWVTTTRTLTALLAGDRRRGPDLLLLATGAWDMLLSGSVWDARAERRVRKSYTRTLRSLRGAWRASGLTLPKARVLYGNWPCNTTTRYAWRSKYSRATRSMRDWYRNASSTAGYAYLDIEHSLNTLPPMAASPCGNQHPFGAIAEAHTDSLLSAYAHIRETVSSN